MKLNRIICNILLLLVVSLKAFSNEKRFDRIDMTSGLSHNSALCLLEDHDGFVWIGTRDGLNKYNGTSLKVFKHIFLDSTSLVNNQVNCLFETQKHEIWIGTANGLSMYKPETNRFQTFPLSSFSTPLESYYIRTIYETNDGKLWVGTTQGLIIINESRTNADFLKLESDEPELSNNIRKIFQDSNGTIWLGTTYGLYRKTGKTFEQYFFDTHINKLRQPIRDIVEAKDGALWLGSESNGIYIINTQGKNPKVESVINSANSDLPSDIVRAIFFEDDENIWIGTFGGLCICDSATKVVNRINSKSFEGNTGNNSIHDIIGDSQGGIWTAIYLGGVQYYHHQKSMFEHTEWHTNQSSKIRSNIVSVLLEDNNNHLWLGTEGGGLYSSKDEGKTLVENIQISDSQASQNTIKSLTLGNNHLWIGTLQGLSSYHLKSKNITNYYHNPESNNSLNAGHVLALLYENKEKVWIGTNGGGVQVFNPLNSTFENIKQLENQHVSCFYQDSKKRIWIGCEEDIFLYDGNNKIELSEIIENWNEGVSDVTFIKEDSRNNLWIGTRGMGLYLLKNNKLFWFNTSTGLVDNTINSLLEGGINQYWITSNRGLSKIIVTEGNSGEPKISSETYSRNQGVQGLQFSPNCALKLSSGKLMFGGINGINSFRHSDITDDNINPKLVFTELRVDYKIMQSGEEQSPLLKSLNETNELVLDYNQRDFSISFTGINFINPDKNIYRYKVEGIDDVWVEMGNQSNINFTYFPIGTYEIEIQVTTNAGNWNANYRSLTITILPPWWKTWWAFLIYAAVLGLLLGLFFFLSQRWAKMKNQLLMHNFQREKENELHQLKLKFYTDVSHELRTPLTLILAPLENLISKTELTNRFRNQLLQIQRSGFRLMQLVNQILDLRKLETGHEELQIAEGNIIRFFSEISLAFKEVATSKNIHFEFHSHKEELSVWYDRDKLEIILNNLLSNAFKFTPSGGKVQLYLSEIVGDEIKEQFPALNKKNSYLQISVFDSGEGIRPEDLAHIYNRFYSKKENNKQQVPNAGVGLELTKRMIELHKGGINVISSEPEKDKKETIFSVFLSLNKNVYSDDELDFDFKNSEDPSLYTTEFLQQEMVLEVQETEEEKHQPVDDNEFERLLIVEDNSEVRSFIRELFVDDYEISEAENGEIGLQKAIETNPQLIISDVMMPVMDGIELCKKIKTDARTSHIPVVLLTARTALTFKYDGLETGADDYITKPFSARYLKLRVKNLIKQRQTIQEHFKRKAICDPGSITLTSVDEKILKKAVNYISENISDSSINVNKISAHVGLSRVHFYRKIKALTNQTAVEFIRNIRLKRAATLLAQDKLSVKEVRNMVGFDDADYFRDCFKEQFGATPSEYHSDNS